MFATLFDFDGVLVDSEPVHLAAINDVLAAHDVVITEEEYVTNLMALDDASVFRTVLSRRDLTVREEQVRALVEAKSPRFLERFASSFRSFPGATELVRRRAARGPVGVVSGALEREIAFSLERMGVRASVAFIVSAERTAEHKPHPGPFLQGVAELRRLGHGAAIVAIEDSLGGVASAKGAGLRCAAVAHSYGRDELLAAGADVAVDDLASLTDAVLEG